MSSTALPTLSLSARTVGQEKVAWFSLHLGHQQTAQCHPMECLGNSGELSVRNGYGFINRYDPKEHVFGNSSAIKKGDPRSTAAV